MTLFSNTWHHKFKPLYYTEHRILGKNNWWSVSNENIHCSPKEMTCATTLKPWWHFLKSEGLSVIRKPVSFQREICLPQVRVWCWNKRQTRTMNYFWKLTTEPTLKLNQTSEQKLKFKLFNRCRVFGLKEMSILFVRTATDTCILKIKD